MLVLRGNPHTCQSLLSLRLDSEDRGVNLPPVFSRREIPKVTADVTAPLPLLLRHSSS